MVSERTKELIAKMRAKQPVFKKLNQKFRLPDGSKFEATYDAAKEQWTATLTVGTEVYHVEKSGIHWTMRACGQAWAQAHGVLQQENSLKVDSDARVEGFSGCGTR